MLPAITDDLLPAWVLLNSSLDGTCRIWTGRKLRGYPHYGGRIGTRRAYREVVGEFDDALELDHLCRRPPCINPLHLEPVTRAENMRRRYALITHCVNNHEFSEENTYRRPSGHRDCRTCIRERRRKCDALKRGLVAA